MNDHIDQIAQWYADAEQITETNLPRSGDTLIFPYNAGGYALEVEEDNWTPDDIVSGDGARILSRAPKPKPAWHDAKAVIASTDYCERQVWERDSLGWYGTAGDTANTEDLRDVTPLIEAKVTDEMVERAVSAARIWVSEIPDSLAHVMLTAALGIEDGDV